MNKMKEKIQEVMWDKFGLGILLVVLFPLALICLCFKQYYQAFIFFVYPFVAFFVFSIGYKYVEWCFIYLGLDIDLDYDSLKKDENQSSGKICKPDDEMNVYRKPTEQELKFAAMLNVKDPVIKEEEGSISYLSGKCFYCDKPWKYELEVDVIDSVTIMPTGTSTEVYVCESCRKEGLPRVEPERLRVIGERKQEEEEKEGI